MLIIQNSLTGYAKRSVSFDLTIFVVVTGILRNAGILAPFIQTFLCG